MAEWIARLIPGAALLAGIALAPAHPIAPAWLLLGLAMQAALLWCWPGFWLVSIPALLPLLDFSPWTGWLLVGEADLLLLVTLGVLGLRAPPNFRDFALPGQGGWVLGAYAIVTLGGVLLGLLVPGPAEGTANILLSPWNGVRVGKALVFALALAPFLWARQRARGDAASMLGVGVVLGMVGIAGLVALERMAFPGLLNFGSEYRVSASFASMHVGGGHIGAYLAMSLPFLAAVAVSRFWWGLPLALAGGACGAFALVVTFARTAYAAALVGVAVTVVGLAVASARAGRAHGGGRVGLALVAVLVLAGVGGGIVASAREGRFMASRLEHISPDLAERLRNWTQGLALRAPGLAAAVAGAGIGTYPRLAHAAAPDRVGPSNFVLGRDGDGPFLSLHFRGPFYFGQKLGVAPGAALRVALRLRAGGSGGGQATAGQVTFGLCEKWLLYSEDCATASHRPAGGGWETVSLSMTVPGRTRAVRRPVEFWVNAPPGAVIELAGARITDAAGRELARNGDFRDGVAGWFFTDDSHGSWRIFNQYFATLFEGGVLGVAALLALFGAGFAAAWAGIGGGDRTAAALAGAVAAFAISCLFDAQLEAPRVALLFYLAILAALGCSISQGGGFGTAGTGGTGGTPGTGGLDGAGTGC